MIYICGAGRGPLVAGVLRALERTARKARVYAVEKNASAFVTSVLRACPSLLLALKSLADILFDRFWLVSVCKSGRRSSGASLSRSSLGTCGRSTCPSRQTSSSRSCSDRSETMSSHQSASTGRCASSNVSPNVRVPPLHRGSADRLPHPLACLCDQPMECRSLPTTLPTCPPSRLPSCSTR